jgi:hypothetical protein
LGGAALAAGLRREEVCECRIFQPIFASRIRTSVARPVASIARSLSHALSFSLADTPR